MYKRILHPTDYLPQAELALEHSIYLARKYHAELHLMHVVTPEEIQEINQDGADLWASVDRRMVYLLRKHGVSKKNIKRIHALGQSIMGQIIGYVRMHAIDLVILGQNDQENPKAAGLSHALARATLSATVLVVQRSVLEQRVHLEWHQHVEIAQRD